MENKLKEAESKISQLIALDSILDSQLEFLRSQFLSASNRLPEKERQSFDLQNRVLLKEFP